MTIETIASVAHEANRQLCQANGTETHLPWNEASDEHKSRMIAGVEWNLANPDASDSAQHDQWMDKMLADGWTYGINGRDEQAKTHHCLVAYDLLPSNQRAKDHLFKAIVKSLSPFLMC